MITPDRPLAWWRIGAILLGAAATIVAGLYALSRGQYAAMESDQIGVSVAWHSKAGVVAFTTAGTATRPLPEGRVYQLNLANMTTRLLFEEDAPVSALVFSRDSRRLAYTKQTGDGDVTMVRDIASKKAWKVSGPSKTCRFPVLFAPDGRGIIETRSARYLERSRYPTSDWDIWLVDIKTGAERRLTELALRWPIVPALLPDGKSVVFVGEKRLKWFAYRAALTEGGAVRNLAPVVEGASPTHVPSRHELRRPAPMRVAGCRTRPTPHRAVHAAVLRSSRSCPGRQNPLISTLRPIEHSL